MLSVPKLIQRSSGHVTLVTTEGMLLLSVALKKCKPHEAFVTYLAHILLPVIGFANVMRGFRPPVFIHFLNILIQIVIIVTIFFFITSYKIPNMTLIRTTTTPN